MDLSRNDELLLYCLRVVQDETGDGRLEGLSSSDWDVVFKESRRYGVAPLLYHRLRTSHSGTPVPASAMEKLQLVYLQSSARNMHLYQELGKILERLRHDSIQVIALKGVHVAAAVYQNIALRPMEDIDLLVKQTDLLRAQEILVKQGYISPKEENSGFLSRLRICASTFAHVPERDSFVVEIHFNIVGPPFSLQLDVEKAVGQGSNELAPGHRGIDTVP